ncbi:MAG: HAMP domain-containing histidine kinase [Tatlockia sp.]|nr:HAMP domain-containing histidine kinase [Tatlockia sp.]
MKKTTPTLSDEIKKNIVSRIVLCIFILAVAHVITIGFYIYLFTTQTQHHLDQLSEDLTPYIISQEIIKNRYAINLKLDELSNANNIKIQWFKKPSEKNGGLKFSGILNWKYTVPVRAVDNKYYGYYIISGSLLSDQWMMVGLFMQFFFLIIFVMLFCFILYPIAYRIPKKIIINPINTLVELLHKNDPAEIDSFTAPYEIVLLRDHFIKILSIQNEILKKTEMLKISTQVAHDIRSPLAAINVAISDVSSIPESKRIMIKNASQRINDIANNLLSRAKSEIPGANNKQEVDIFPELIFVVLDSIITEKRYEYDKLKINFHLNVSESAYSCFSDINLGAFKRILSNLINNSIEAINSNGKIIVCLSSDNHVVEISIQDNGCGIPHDILSNVMVHGFSFNKKNGAGLGLAYAKQQIEQIKGEIALQSTINIGTKVIITLPKSDFPPWFCENIDINYNAKIIVLDDDPSIHDAWNERFNHLPHIDIAHFYRASDFTKEDIPFSSTDLYLVDYELLNDNLNGLNLIEKLRLNKNAVLVTSCFEDKAVRVQCEKLGVKIIPKPFVPYIPILNSTKNQTSSLVFIDNDDLMRTVWSLAAEEAGLIISTYSSPNEFNNDINKYRKDTLIYIDSDLGDNIKGEQFAKHLYDLGFTKLYLATGYPPEHFGRLPWIKLIVSKKPPFIDNLDNQTAFI